MNLFLPVYFSFWGDQHTSQIRHTLDVYSLTGFNYIALSVYMQVTMNESTEPIKIFKALSEETRLRILWLLDERELSVNDVVETLNSTQSRISRHLTVLKEAGFLDLRREGTWSYYRKADEERQTKEITQAWELVRDWAKNHPQAERDRRTLRKVVQRKKNESRRFFGKYADRWDTLRSQICGDLVTTQAMESLIPPTLTVADVGTGTGHLLIPLARVVHRVIGVDNTKAMLDVAQAKAHEIGVDNAEFRLGEMDDLPFEDNELDAVFAGLVLHHAPDPQTAIHEMARVVKPGATVTIIDLQRHHEEWLREELADQWLGFEEDDLQRWFQKAGLKHLRWMEGIQVQQSQNGKKSLHSNLRSFVFYGRKPRL